MGFALKAFGINFVDIFSARRPRGEPAAGCDHLQSADGCVVSRGVGQLGRNRLTREARFLDAIGRELLEPRPLFGRSRRVDASVLRCSKLGSQLAVVLAGILAGLRSDLRGKEIHDWTVFIRGPDCAVEAEKARAGAFLPTEAERPVQQAVDEPLKSDVDFD